jgi:hypothetical protein
VADRSLGVRWAIDRCPPHTMKYAPFPSTYVPNFYVPMFLTFKYLYLLFPGIHASHFQKMIILVLTLKNFGYDYGPLW